jgi:hypothetical protein
MPAAVAVLAALGLFVLMSACSSAPTAKPAGRILLVDAHGVPVQGALVLQEYDEESRYNRPIEPPVDDRDPRISDAEGIVHADLAQYLWDSDGCYHFQVQRRGFEDFALTVSRELFPAVLTITLDSVPQRTKKPAAPAPRQP